MGGSQVRLRAAVVGPWPRDVAAASARAQRARCALGLQSIDLQSSGQRARAIELVAQLFSTARAGAFAGWATGSSTKICAGNRIDWLRGVLSAASYDGSGSWQQRSAGRRPRRARGLRRSAVGGGEPRRDRGWPHEHDQQPRKVGGCAGAEQHVSRVNTAGLLVLRRLHKKGLKPFTKDSLEAGRKFPYVLFSAPPSGSPDYAAEVRPVCRDPAPDPPSAHCRCLECIDPEQALSCCWSPSLRKNTA